MVATMHFIPPASHWLPSVETMLKSCSWLQFASMLLDRFGRDQHELLVRQLINIKQFGSVSEYIDRFAGLVDQLAAYEGPPISLHHTMRFIDGLKDELKSAVLIQCPKDIDTAYILAQLQEDLYESAGKKREYRKLESSFPSKPYFKTASPTLSQNARHNKASSSVAEDRRTTDSARATSADDKWRSPKAFRRSKGLCQFCAERWTKEHKCADNIHLNVVQELMAIFQSDEDEDSDTGEAPQIYMTLSVAALSGLPAPRTLCLSGDIQSHKISILVDSGSSHSFICSSVASKLQGVSSLQSPLSVKVANGQKLSCSTHIVNAAWYVDGFDFHTDLKVLQLSAYDMILGMDWLDVHSPMKIHWQQKWLSIPYQGSTVVLCGNRPNLLKALSYIFVRCNCLLLILRCWYPCHMKFKL